MNEFWVTMVIWVVAILALVGTCTLTFLSARALKRLREQLLKTCAQRLDKRREMELKLTREANTDLDLEKKRLTARVAELESELEIYRERSYRTAAR